MNELTFVSQSVAGISAGNDNTVDRIKVTVTHTALSYLTELGQQKNILRGGFKSSLFLNAAYSTAYYGAAIWK